MLHVLNKRSQNNKYRTTNCIFLLLKTWGWAKWSVLHRIVQDHFYRSKICVYNWDPSIGHWKSGLFEGWFAKWLTIQKLDISVWFLNGKTKWQPFWPKPFKNWTF